VFANSQRAAGESLAHETFPGAEARIIADYAGWDRLAIIHTPMDVS
jgi:hypothetical protein